jgi:hypothetical protein
MTIKWIEGGLKEDTNQYNNQPSQMKQSIHSSQTIQESAFRSTNLNLMKNI